MWWDELWLNEGFAEYMQYVVCAEIFPSWDLNAVFFTNEQLPAFFADATKYSHPIYSRLEYEADARYLFDDITYCKGAAVIRMMAHLVDSVSSVDGMLPSLGNYIQDHLCGSGSTADLLEAVQMSVPALREIMYRLNKLTYNKE